MDMSFLTRTNAFMVDLFGEDAWLVGGAPRNKRLHKPIKDCDYVVVNHSMFDVSKILENDIRVREVKPLKLRTGQVGGYRAVVKGVGAIEIMLPRTEAKRDGAADVARHAFAFDIGPDISLAEDAVRRDFTFNAIYENAKTGDVFDPLHGEQALVDGMIFTTHVNSFADDPLRILRALRFQSVYGFTMPNVTAQLMQRHADRLNDLTGPNGGTSNTAFDELCKILMGQNVAAALRTARDSGALAVLLPELRAMIGFEQQNDAHNFTVDEHTFVALDAAARMGCSLRVRLALLFHDAGKPEVAWMGDDGMLHFYACEREDGNKEDHAVASARIAEVALSRLSAPKALVKDVLRLISGHMVPLSMRVKPTKVRKWRVQYGDELLADLFKHRLADCMGKGAIDYEQLSAIARMERIREEAVEQKVPASTGDLKRAGLIDGRDLIALDVPQDKIGSMLATLLHEVVSDPGRRMDREWLLSRAEKLAKKA